MEKNFNEENKTQALNKKSLGGLYVAVAVFAMVVAFITFYFLFVKQYVIVEPISRFEKIFHGGLVDDWMFDSNRESKENIDSLKSFSGMIETEAISDSIGFAVGGAKDVNNFRENINNDYTPLPTDITYEGLYYDYYFDTGKEGECRKLFCPSYQYAISKDPISGEDDYYLSVGLNSNLKESDFERKSLNLVLVLDISGSMSSSFKKYYYDRFGNKVENKYYEEEKEKKKMDVANEAVVSLLKHLKLDDRFGMVVFNSDATLAKPLNLVGDTDMDKIKEHIREIPAGGGTNMEAGIKEATKLYSEYLEIDKEKYENRIIFLTDAMPNRGATGKDGLFGLSSDNASNGIYTSFIGIGVDFNTELIETLTKIKGANYYSVHSGYDFRERLDEEFEFMVTPLVFDLALTLEADGFEISKVYGSPEADEATGEIMRVNTLFPSRSKEGETRGGIVILKLQKTSDSASIVLKTSYKDRAGRKDGSEAEIEISQKSDYYANSGIRKGIILARYADLIKSWINDTRKYYKRSEPKPFDFWINRERGLWPPEPMPALGQWERESIDLEVSEHYGIMFKVFKNYFSEEIKSIGDKNLEQELEMIDKLIKVAENPDFVIISD